MHAVEHISWRVGLAAQDRPRRRCTASDSQHLKPSTRSGVTERKVTRGKTTSQSFG
jgi:hypothetical protein